MTKKAQLVGAVVASAGLLATGAHAHADGVDNDGVNIGQDNNISLLPVTLCGDDVAVLGVILPIASPESVQCLNAAITDHPQVDNSDSTGGRIGTGEHSGAVDGLAPGKIVIPAEQSNDLPEAPAPVPVQGHHAVTG